jgi:hypothetical protein
MRLVASLAAVYGRLRAAMFQKYVRLQVEMVARGLKGEIKKDG